MELKLKCNIPTSQIEEFDSNRALVVSTLIQAGIKMFLHQRNQIPLPYEHLMRNSITLHQNGNGGMQVKDKEEDGKESMRTEDKDEEDVKDRIKFMIADRKRRKCHVRMQKKMERQLRKQAVAAEKIHDCLQVLDEQIQQHLSDIVAVGLFFGTSSYSSREVVVFDLSNIGVACDKEGNENEASMNQQTLALITRTFYKNIIISEEFCEFTEKNLPSTKSQVYFITKGQHIHGKEESQLQLVGQVEFFTNLLFDEANNMEPCGDPSVEEEKRESKKKEKKKKILKLKIQIPSGNNGCEKVDDHESDLENNLFCYQIPFGLKGTGGIIGKES